MSTRAAGERRIIPRQEWADNEVHRLPLVRGRPIRETWIHHSARSIPGGADATESQERAFLREVERFHIRERGWFSIGYSFVIMPSGRIYEGRGWGARGAHTKDRNLLSYGICFAGDFMQEDPTESSISACRRLLSAGIREGWLSGTQHPTGGHRDVVLATTCPGDRLAARLGDLRPEPRPS